MRTLHDLIGAYDPDVPLDRASTITAPWYTDERILELERASVFSSSWQLAGRREQVRDPGQFVSVMLPSGDPVVVVRGGDGVLRAFFNVCRHHAAAVVVEPEGSARVLRCPYHGWTYSLEGELKGTPDFTGVCGFDRSANGLVGLEADVWEQWVFVRALPGGATLAETIGAETGEQVRALDLGRQTWVARRVYSLACNWKVFVDNYLDGGYHVPHLHKGLDSVLDYSSYTIETFDRVCLQSSPIVHDGADRDTRAVRSGDRARYYWLYPNFMVNWYAGAMDTNLVIPRAVDRTDVVFDFYFADASEQAAAYRRNSIAVSERIQDEDVAICESVQRGLKSRAYSSGRLSVRREAGEHLFHRLLHADLTAGLTHA